jgi:hypothetical protein
VDPAASELPPRYRWSGWLVRLGGVLAGRAVPLPEYAPTDRPEAVLSWMAETIRAGRTPHLWTFPSSAVRLAQEAAATGWSLEGLQLTLGGEPITPARLEALRRLGAQVLPSYSGMEAISLAGGCLAPEAADEVHYFSDLYALVQPERQGPRHGAPPLSLWLSTLRPTAPVLLINGSLGDQAILGERACGCPLEQPGWTTHLQRIRSFEKLTAGGMTFLDSDIIRVLEEVLPARFGGGATDYQLVEDVTADGQPRLRLLVSPMLGPLDEQEIAETLLASIGGYSATERVMELQWRTAGLLQVERQAPRQAASGKILHLHQNQTSSA